MTKYIFIFTLLISCLAYSQAPPSFKYQAVVRNASGVLLSNQLVSIKTSILSDSENGSVVYSEKQVVSTNEYGVVALNIGDGSVISGSFSSIDWGSTIYFVKTELDINGAENFIFMGTSQIMSVPYALFAEKAKKATNDNDTSAVNEIQTLSLNGNSISISNGNSIVLPPDNDGDITNELQNLTINGNEVTISNGNTIVLPPNNDNDPNNEFQNLTLNGNELQISNGNSVSLPPDNDADPTNEIQTITIVGDSLKISNGNAVYLAGSIDLDANPSNELQILSRNGDTLFISNGNYVLFNDDLDKNPTNEIQNLSATPGSISISQGNSIVLADSSATNELQNLSINQGTISISEGNQINLPDSSATNELQTLSIDGDSLRISNGNSVKINTKNHYIGEKWGGGIIFHLYSDTLGVQHGLIATINTYNGIYDYIPHFTTNDWDGKYNSDYVNTFNPNVEINCIFKIAKDLIIVDDGISYDDWYVPSKNELNLYCRFLSKNEYFIYGTENLIGTALLSSSNTGDASSNVKGVYYNTIDNILEIVVSASNVTNFMPIRKF